MRAAALLFFGLALVVVVGSMAAITPYGKVVMISPQIEDIIIAVALAGVGVIAAYFGQSR